MFFINTLLYVSVGLMNLQFGERLSLEPRILSIRHEYPCLILQVLCNMKREAYQYFLSLHHAEIVVKYDEWRTFVSVNGCENISNNMSLKVTSI